MTPPGGVTIRAGEGTEADALVEAAFGEDGAHVARVLAALRDTAAVRAELVAEDDGVVVGHVGLSRGWLDTRERLLEVLVLSPLAVAPDRQREGIGAALVDAALAEADRLGAPATFLEGDPSYYSRRGFEPGAERGFTRPSVRIPGPAFQVALGAAYEPSMVGALVYPEAFWATDSVGLRDPLLAQLGS